MSFLKPNSLKYSPDDLYSSTINDYLNIEEFTPKNKDEIQPIIIALNTILNPPESLQDRVETSPSLNKIREITEVHSEEIDKELSPINQRVKRLQELKLDMEFLGLPEEERESFGKLVNSLIKTKIDNLKNSDLLKQQTGEHNQLKKQREDTEKSQKEAQEFGEKKEKAFAEENKGTSLETNVRKLNEGGIFSNIELGQLATLYSEEQIKTLRNNGIVNAIVLKKISLEDAFKIGNLITSGAVSIDDLFNLPEEHFNALSNDANLRDRIVSCLLSFDTFKQIPATGLHTKLKILCEVMQFIEIRKGIRTGKIVDQDVIEFGYGTFLILFDAANREGLRSLSSEQLSYLHNSLDLVLTCREIVLQKKSIAYIEKLSSAHLTALIKSEPLRNLISLRLSFFNEFLRADISKLNDNGLKCLKIETIFFRIADGKLSIKDFLIIQEKPELLDILIQPGVSTLLHLGEISGEELKHPEGPFIREIRKIEDEQKKRVQEAGLEPTSQNMRWLQHTKILQFGRRKNHEESIRFTHLFLLAMASVGFLLAGAVLALLPLGKRAFIPMAGMFVNAIGVYSLAFDYINHGTRLIKYPPQPLSLIKRIAYVAMIVLSLWLDEDTGKYRTFLFLTANMVVLAAANAINFSKSNVIDNDNLANNYSTKEEVEGAKTVFLAEQKRNREAREKSWGNWLMYNSDGDYRIRITEPSLSSRIKGIQDRLT